jgi:hypothetical protein
MLRLLPIPDTLQLPPIPDTFQTLPILVMLKAPAIPRTLRMQDTLLQPLQMLATFKALQTPYFLKSKVLE